MRFKVLMLTDLVVFLSLLAGACFAYPGLVNIGYFALWLLALCGLAVFNNETAARTVAKVYRPTSEAWRFYLVMRGVARTVVAFYFGWFVLGFACAAVLVSEHEFIVRQEEKLRSAATAGADQ